MNFSINSAAQSLPKIPSVKKKQLLPCVISLIDLVQSVCVRDQKADWDLQT